MTQQEQIDELFRIVNVQSDAISKLSRAVLSNSKSITSIDIAMGTISGMTAGKII